MSVHTELIKLYNKDFNIVYIDNDNKQEFRDRLNKVNKLTNLLELVLEPNDKIAKFGGYDEIQKCINLFSNTIVAIFKMEVDGIEKFIKEQLINKCRYIKGSKNIWLKISINKKASLVEIVENVVNCLDFLFKDSDDVSIFVMSEIDNIVEDNKVVLTFFYFY